MKNILLILSLTLFLFSTFILFFYSYLFRLKNLAYKPKTISLIKNKDFILFKISLFKFYYSILIILLTFILKHKGLTYLLDLNVYNLFIFVSFSIVFICSILLSNCFNLKLFYLYKNIKNNINLLNETNFNLDVFYSFNNKINIKNNRNYSTSTHNDNILDLGEIISVEKAKHLKEFHSKYDVFAGYYGYKNIYHLGHYTDFDDLTFNLLIMRKNLKDFLDLIPESEVHSILPLLKFEIPGSDSSSLTLTEAALKITKYTSAHLLAIKILELVKLKFNFYNLDLNSVEILLMGRPWLSEADFNVPIEVVKETLEQSLIAENNLKYTSPSKYNLISKNKASELKIYYYKNIIMDNYGTPIYSSDQKNIIGYNLMEGIYATVVSQQNDQDYKRN